MPAVPAPSAPRPQPIPPSSSIHLNETKSLSSPAVSHPPTVPDQVPPTTTISSFQPTPKTFEPAVAQTSPSTLLPGDSRAVSLIESLRILALTLPSSVRIADSDGPLAFFNYGVYLEEVSVEDAWEELDPVLNRLCGSDVPESQLDKMMERGMFRVDALCAWLKAIVEDYRVKEELLKGKVERLKASLRRW